MNVVLNYGTLTLMALAMTCFRGTTLQRQMNRHPERALFFFFFIGWINLVLAHKGFATNSDLSLEDQIQLESNFISWCYSICYLTTTFIAIFMVIVPSAVLFAVHCCGREMIPT